MRFSLFHLPSFFPRFHRSEEQFYQDMLLETEKADAYGFHSAWFAEHHFHPYGGHIPSVPVLGAAVAQRTKNIRIGSGIALLPLQDPIRLAEEYAMLDCLSGGRLESRTSACFPILAGLTTLRSWRHWIVSRNMSCQEFNEELRMQNEKLTRQNKKRACFEFFILDFQFFIFNF